MPIDEVLTIQGTVDDEQRRRPAEEVTTIHTEETGAPIDFVHVWFPELPEGRTFSGGRSART